MEIKIIHEEEIKNLPKSKKYIIFGAGDFGLKVVLPLLLNSNIEVDAIWDNDIKKQGVLVNNIEIISFEGLKKYNDFVLIVGSNYIYQEEKRIITTNCCDIIQIALPENILNVPKEYIDSSIINIEKNVRKLFSDKTSLESIDAFLNFLKNNDVSVFSNVASNEKHYLIKEVLDSLRPDDTLVDLGAFIGEFPIDLKTSGIPFKKCYSFEISAQNCDKLNKYVSEYALQDKVECVMKAASDKNGYIYINNDGANTKIVNEETENRVEAVMLDDFFASKEVNYIKTDIEGGEMFALRGSQSLLKRTRPILAISIYHSLSDYQNIPLFLNELLCDYTFFIRNHSIYCAEIVLYAIPNERYVK